MTYATRPKATGMIVCDLCDEEIEQGQGAGPDSRASIEISRGNLMHGISPAPGTVTSKTRHALLCWGRTRVRSSRPDLDEGVSYDFHGRCIADLVAREVAARESTDSVAR